MKPIIKRDGFSITLVNRAEILKHLQPQIKKLLKLLKAK